MKRLIGYALLFMPVVLQCMNGSKNFLIAKGKIVDPLYDSEEKKKYLLFRAVIELIMCAAFMIILVIVLGYNRFIVDAINPFIILFLLFALQYFFLGVSLILAGKNKISAAFYDSDAKRRLSVTALFLFYFVACFAGIIPEE